jgi:hypothetical protein
VRWPSYRGLGKDQAWSLIGDRGATRIRCLKMVVFEWAWFLESFSVYYRRIRKKKLSTTKIWNTSVLNVSLV